MKFKRAVKRYYKTFIWLLFMSYMLFTPGSTIPKSGIFEIPNFDKVIHFSMFTIFTFLWLNDSKNNSFIIIFSILVISICFAALSEIIQYAYIPGRSGNILDFLSDLSGLITALLFYYLIWKKITVQKIKSN
jgi:VanZ family protein